MLNMNSIFSDGMVLQRQKKVKVFGRATANQKVIVTIPERGIQVEGQADANEEFQIQLPEQEVGEPCTLVVTAGQEKLEFHDVLFGEVWFAGGQSNMELELGNCKQGPEELARLAQEKKETGKDSDIRFYFTVKMPYENEEWKAKQKASHWCSVNDESAHILSAVGYFAAKRIQEKLQVPVGVINCNHGGTSISCWMKLAELETFENGRWYIQEYQKLVGDKSNEEYLAEMEEYQKTLDNYLKTVERIKEEAASRGETVSGEQMNELAGPYPWPQPQGWLSPYRPGGLAETMLAKVVPYTVRGICYYQGEEDSNRWERYADMLSHLITIWRELWQEENLPVLLMQLPMFLEKGAQDDGSWVGIRRAQEQISKEKEQVYLVPLCDLGEYDNIHPVDKLTPGTRLGGMILNTVYGQKEEGMPMVYAGSFAEAGTLTLYFNNSGGGILVGKNAQGEEPDLISARQAEQEGIEIQGFEIAGADGRFYKADAYVERDFILLTSPEVPKPLLARYAWANYIRANVYNKQGLPLVPFLG